MTTSSETLAKPTLATTTPALVAMLLERLQEAAFLIDPSERVAYGNTSAQALLECSAQELSGMKVQDLPLDSLAQAWPEQAALKSFRIVDRCRHGSNTSRSVVVSYEYDSSCAYGCLLIWPIESIEAINAPREEIKTTFPSSTESNHPLLENVFRFIEDNHMTPISLKDVAKAVGYCSSYLTNFVHHHTGQPVNYWIIKRRLTLACQLLQDTRRSVTDIALAVGYQNEGHFFRQFRQHCGTTPSAWRKQHRPGG